MANRSTSRALALLLAALAGAAALPAQARSVALLVAVGDYRDDRLDMPGVARDLAKAEQMVRRLGVAPAATVRLVDGQATVAAVEAQLQRWARELTPADRAIVYFSAHGLQLADQNGDEGDGRDEALALVDFRLGERDDAQPIGGVLRDDRLAELLAALPSRRKLVIADTCHSGSISKSLGDVFERVGKFIQLPRWLSGEPSPATEEPLAEIAQPGLVLLSAAGDGELADVDASGSAFSQALLETQLDPAQDNAWCWFRRASARVRRSSGGVQWPQFGGAPAEALAPLSGDGALAGVAMAQRCAGGSGVSAQLQAQGLDATLAARAREPGWVTAVAVSERGGELQLRPTASRWHHGRERLARLGRARPGEGAAWVIWTADAVVLPRLRGDFAPLWRTLQNLPDQHWASAWVPGVDVDDH